LVAGNSRNSRDCLLIETSGKFHRTAARGAVRKLIHNIITRPADGHRPVHARANLLMRDSAEVTVPSLDDWEKEWQENPRHSVKPKLLPVDFQLPIFADSTSELRTNQCGGPSCSLYEANDSLAGVNANPPGQRPLIRRPQYL
jgi:hypothetical protein